MSWVGRLRTKKKRAGLAGLVNDIRLLGKMSWIDIFRSIHAEVKDM